MALTPSSSISDKRRPISSRTWSAVSSSSSWRASAACCSSWRVSSSIGFATCVWCAAAGVDGGAGINSRFARSIDRGDIPAGSLIRETIRPMRLSAGFCFASIQAARAISGVVDGVRSSSRRIADALNPARSISAAAEETATAGRSAVVGAVSSAAEEKEEIARPRPRSIYRGLPSRISEGSARSCAFRLFGRRAQLRAQSRLDAPAVLPDLCKVDPPGMIRRYRSPFGPPPPSRTFTRPAPASFPRFV